MAYTNGEVLEALLQLIRSNVSGSFVGTVKSTDKAESDGIIEVEANELAYEVRLQAVASTSKVGVLLVPKVSSMVFCTAEGNSDNAYVAVSLSEVERVKLVIDNTSIEVDGSTIIFNGGELGSMVVIDDLVSRLNTIEKAFNNLLNAYKAHNHAHPQGATTELVPPYTAKPISETKASDIENDKIKQ